jgi:rhamnulokinase
MDRMIARVGREALYDATGIQLVWFNTLPQLFAQREAEPDMVDRADQLLFMPDLMHYFFTGRRLVESSIASTSQMIDPRSGRWAVDLLDKLDIPTRMLRGTIPPGTPIGPLLPHVAAEIGADEDLQVIAPASHDTASAMAAVPADRSTNWCVLSSGTWSPMGTEIERPCLTPEAREASFTNESGVAGTIRFLNNIPGLWLVQECRRHFAKQGQSYDYDRLTREAERAEPFRTLVDPAHEPFHVPGDMPAKMAAFARKTGQAEPRSVGELVRCCLDSLALSYRRNLERLESVLDRRFDLLHIVGGGSKNTLLNQMTADAIGRPVIAGPAEATAIGNLLVQAMGAGHVRDLEHIRRIVSASVQPLTYQPRPIKEWEHAYERYVGIVDR